MIYRKRGDKLKRFWDWIKNEETAERTLRLDGRIAEYSWWDDEVTPTEFRQELYGEKNLGDITVWINSPGGDVFAGAQIYNMLKEYPYKVNTQIDGLAASAASVIAMAGDEIRMTPVSMLMIHNPWSIALGDSYEMERMKKTLDEVKESIINSYVLKTKLSRVKISHMMDEETWMSSGKAVELGFADKIIYTDAETGDIFTDLKQGVIFNRASIINPMEAFIKKVKRENEAKTPPDRIENKTSIETLRKRLFLIK